MSDDESPHYGIGHNGTDRLIMCGR